MSATDKRWPVNAARKITVTRLGMDMLGRERVAAKEISSGPNYSWLGYESCSKNLLPLEFNLFDLLRELEQSKPKSHSNKDTVIFRPGFLSFMPIVSHVNPNGPILQIKMQLLRSYWQRRRQESSIESSHGPRSSP